MNSSTIELITQCTEYLKQEGYSETCYKVHNRKWRHSLLPFMETHGMTEFSESVGREYLKYLKSKVSKDNYRAFDRSIKILIDFSSTGKVRERIVDRVSYPLSGKIGELAELYLHSLQEGGLKNDTIKDRQRFLYYFIHYLDNIGITEPGAIELSIILPFFSQEKTNKVKRIATIRGFCEFLFENGVLPVNYSGILHESRSFQEEKVPSAYSQEEINLMIASIDRASSIGKRNYAIFLIASSLGLRASDIAALCWSNIDWDRNKILFTQIKTGVKLELPLLRVVGEALVDYVKHSRPQSNESTIFLSGSTPFRPMTRSSIYKVISKIISVSGVEVSNRRHGPHALRHSLASNLLKGNIQMPTIASILGHSYIQTTQQYIRIDTNHLRDCVLEVPIPSEEFYLQKGGAFYV